MDLLPEKEIPWIMELFEKQAKGENSLVENIPVKRKDGTVFYADINTSSVNIAGRSYNLGMFRDVTERKRNEEMRRENERLQLANRTKNDFLSIMSHELRTPLNAIIGFSNLLINKSAGELNEKQQRYAGNVYSSGKHLLGIIDDVLDLTNAESGNMEIIIQKMSVPNAFNTSVDLIKEKAASRNVIIKKQIGHDIEYIETDPNRFRQVLNNLLDNAVKFSKPEGGTVTITAEKEGKMVKFKVSDTGIGIRDEDMWRLFQSFEQLETGISRKYEGTGLGLAISKKLVEILGGRITVESKYGEGSTFTFYLPLVPGKSET
jgi:signal transduction histidine kinase